MKTSSIMAAACMSMAAFGQRGIPLPSPAGQRPYDYKPQSKREKKASAKAAKKRGGPPCPR